ncbi:MAG TPA: serine/threonine-protein kinase [Bryobacteraceae bacterium]|nr:serine/threonine-protein kinase [Bryobacteraceae bacterium]
MIGTEIGNYRILEKLGEGGMGVVYKGVDINLDRTVAIKALNAQLAGNPELEQRFRNEAKAQANLNHTNLATLYALLIEEGRPWMVMEFIEGETFDQMVQRRGPIPSEEAIPLFRQALLGIGYAHRMGIVHRDIKPSNMMVNKQGIVKVMDFGIAKVMGARGMTRTGTQMGTAFYMSPEQVLNRNVDIRSDIYSLGVTLYEMLTANVPFSGDSDYQIMTDHVNTPPPLPTRFYPYIPQGVQNAVLKALEKNPDARFQTVEEFGAALEHPGTIAAAPVVVPAASPVAAVAATVAPAKASFFTPERKIIAGGLGIAAVLVAGWLAIRPSPKPSGLPPAAATGGTGSIFPASGEVLKEYKSTAPASADRSKQGAQQSAKQVPKQTQSTTATLDTPTSAPVATRALVIPAGTVIAVRLIDAVDSSRDQAGKRFAASLDAPVIAGGHTVIPRGANATIVLSSVNQAGHIEGRTEVSLALTAISYHGSAVVVRSSLFQKQGASRGKASAVVIGGGAAVGAAIGGIFGHKKGAAVGAASGAGAGTGERMLTKNPPVVIPSETVIEFTLRSPVSIAQ